MPFLFVGERPSLRAVQIGATWQNGRLAAKQLHDALKALDLDPACQHYCNLWSLPEQGAQDAADEQQALALIRAAVEEGAQVIGMGQVVCSVLSREGIPHQQIVHPAARGAIRLKARYTAHVASVLYQKGSRP